MMSEEEYTTGPNTNSREDLEQAAMQDKQIQDVHAQLLREREEPHEGMSPVPLFLIFLFATLCFICGVYFVKYSGNFQADAFSPNFVPGAAAAAPVEISLFDRGEKVFRSQCVACHQAEGTGVPGVYPPLAGSEWVSESPELLARILINGLNGPIEVKGNSYNGNMPAFGPGGLDLSDKQIAGVLTFIRQSWGNAASEVTIDMMDTYLADYSGRSTPWTVSELKEGLADSSAAE
jgi:mono/diheme cytochrome c family protein